jgi:hypothetical protein
VGLRDTHIHVSHMAIRWQQCKSAHYSYSTVTFMISAVQLINKNTISHMLWKQNKNIMCYVGLINVTFTPWWHRGIFPERIINFRVYSVLSDMKGPSCMVNLNGWRTIQGSIPQRLIDLRLLYGSISTEEIIQRKIRWWLRENVEEKRSLYIWRFLETEEN